MSFEIFSITTMKCTSLYHSTIFTSRSYFFIKFSQKHSVFMGLPKLIFYPLDIISIFVKKTLTNSFLTADSLDNESIYLVDHSSIQCFHIVSSFTHTDSLN